MTSHEITQCGGGVVVASKAFVVPVDNEPLIDRYNCPSSALIGETPVTLVRDCHEVLSLVACAAADCTPAVASVCGFVIEVADHLAGREGMNLPSGNRSLWKFQKTQHLVPLVTHSPQRMSIWLSSSYRRSRTARSGVPIPLLGHTGRGVVGRAMCPSILPGGPGAASAVSGYRVGA